MKHTFSRFSRPLCAVLLCVALASNVGGALAQDDSGGDGGGGGGGEECENPMIDNCRGNNDIHLLQPLDDETKNLTVSSTPLQVFFDYFNMSWPWLLGVASGIAVLQAVWGGILIMTSMDNDGGKEKIEWALGGMVMIALAGFILRFLNPMFYQ